MAASRGVPVTGTLGLAAAAALVLATELDLISLPAANALLEAMIAAGYWSPVATLDDLLSPPSEG